MNILLIDIRTVILLLWMGNLIAVALTSIYNRHSQEQNFPFPFSLCPSDADFWMFSVLAAQPHPECLFCTIGKQFSFYWLGS